MSLVYDLLMRLTETKDADKQAFKNARYVLPLSANRPKKPTALLIQMILKLYLSNARPTSRFVALNRSQIGANPN